MADWHLTTLTFTSTWRTQRVPTQGELRLLQKILLIADYDTPILHTGSQALTARPWRSPLKPFQDTLNLLTTLGFPCRGQQTRSGYDTAENEALHDSGVLSHGEPVYIQRDCHFFPPIDLCTIRTHLRLDEGPDCTIYSQLPQWVRDDLGFSGLPRLGEPSGVSDFTLGL